MKFEPRRYGLSYRRLASVVLFLASCALLLALFTVAWTIPIALGDDWLWYRDGVERLAGGRSLYDARMLSAPFDLVETGLRYVFNQVPWSIPLFAPFALLSEPYAQAAWLLASGAAVIIGLALLWPRRLSISTQLSVAFLVVLNPGFVMSVTWGNLGAWSVLGIGVFWFGYTRRRSLVMSAGLCLAAMKLVPVFGLAVLFARRAPYRTPAIVGFVIATGLLSLPAIVTNGPQVLGDFVLVAANLKQVRMSTNLAPSLWLEPFLDPAVALVLLRLATVAALMVVAWRVRDPDLRIALGLPLSCLLVTNLYADWLMIALAGGLIALHHPVAHDFIETLFSPLTLRFSPAAARAAPLNGR
jgi:hypothetical protein